MTSDWAEGRSKVATWPHREQLDSRAEDALIENVAQALREAEAKGLERAAPVIDWASSVLTALNVGDIKSGSPLHLKLREVIMAYRADAAKDSTT